MTITSSPTNTVDTEALGRQGEAPRAGERADVRANTSRVAENRPGRLRWLAIAVTAVLAAATGVLMWQTIGDPSPTAPVGVVEVNFTDLDPATQSVPSGSSFDRSTTDRVPSGSPFDAR